ncbi:MAG: T9SS type A sorting domain-containing protein, partial [Bacteroidaceae bacterium]|nr:T9SS type A sorting domain-containing protein [Bacteroidaceae bacterium]
EDCHVNVAIYDLSGISKVRYELQLEGRHGYVPATGLAPGIYIARLADSQGNVCTLKFRIGFQK